MSTWRSPRGGMGGMMLNQLGGGPGGIEHFFQQFTGRMTAWWKKELEAERDEVLLGLIELRRESKRRALRGCGRGLSRTRPLQIKAPKGQRLSGLVSAPRQHAGREQTTAQERPRDRKLLQDRRSVPQQIYSWRVRLSPDNTTPRTRMPIDKSPTITTSSGAPVSDNQNSLTAGPFGPVVSIVR